MLKSKDISDFIETKLRGVRAEVAVPVDLHLFFKSNQHVLLWKPAGTVFSSQVINQLINRGIVDVWVHKADWRAFDAFLNPSLIYVPSVKHTELLAIVEGQSEGEGQNQGREKRAKIAKASRTLLGELGAPVDLDDQRRVTQGIAQVVRNFLKQSVKGQSGAASDLWDVTGLNPEFTHSANVATLSVLFAMAFGKVRQKLLVEIATAALLHDIGMTQIPYELTRKSWVDLDDDEKRKYLKHNDQSLELISLFAPGISPTVTTLIRRQHDDYSKRGHLSVAAEIAQLISLADLLDSMCTGGWDGKERSFKEALDTLEKNGPQEFNPEIFASITLWIRKNVSGTESREQKAS